MSDESIGCKDGWAKAYTCYQVHGFIRGVPVLGSWCWGTRHACGRSCREYRVLCCHARLSCRLDARMCVSTAGNWSCRTCWSLLKLYTVCTLCP